MAEGFQSTWRQEGGFSQCVILDIQRGTVGTHQTGDLRTNDLIAKLAFKCAQNAVIVERTALYNDVTTELFCRIDTNHLINGVFDNGNAETCGNILGRCTVLLGLFDRGVHKDGTAGTEIDGMCGESAPFGKFRSGKAHALCKGFQERAAAGGAGFVEHDGIDGTVCDAEALDVLSADIEDEIDFGEEVFCCGEMRDGFDNPKIYAEGTLDELLSISRDSRSAERDAVAAEGIDLLQLSADNLHGIALIGVVILVQQCVVLTDDNELCRCGAAVDAEPCTSCVGCNVGGRNGCLCMACGECVVFCLGGKQRRERIEDRAFTEAVPNCRTQIVQRDAVQGFCRIKCCTACDGIRTPCGKQRGFVAFQMQCFDKTLLQSAAEEQRTAQKQNLLRIAVLVTTDAASLSKPRNGLIDNRLINAGGDIGFVCALIEQRLNIGFGKDTAAGGDRVNTLMLHAQRVHIPRREIEQCRHLVDEGTRTAGTGTVHAFIHCAVKEDDLCIFAAEFYDGRGVRCKHFDNFTCRKDLLDKRNADGLRKTETGRTGNGGRNCNLAVQRKTVEQIEDLFANAGKVPLVGFVNDLFDIGGTVVPAVGKDELCGCGTDIDAEKISLVHELPHIMKNTSMRKSIRKM